MFISIAFKVSFCLTFDHRCLDRSFIPGINACYNRALFMFFIDDMKCPMCERIWRIPGPVRRQVHLPQLIDTPPFTTPNRECDNEISISPTRSVRVDIKEMTPTQSVNREHVDKTRPPTQRKRKITQVYVCPNLWCDYMIHDTPKRSIPRCKQILRRLVPDTNGLNKCETVKALVKIRVLRYF